MAKTQRRRPRARWTILRLGEITLAMSLAMSVGLVAVLVILLRMPSDEEAAAPLVSTVLAVVIALASMAGVLLAIQHATRTSG